MTCVRNASSPLCVCHCVAVVTPTPLLTHLPLQRDESSGREKARSRKIPCQTPFLLPSHWLVQPQGKADSRKRALYRLNVKYISDIFILPINIFTTSLKTLLMAIWYAINYFNQGKREHIWDFRERFLSEMMIKDMDLSNPMVAENGRLFISSHSNQKPGAPPMAMWLFTK